MPKICITFKTIKIVTCKEFYWYSFNTDPHTPLVVQNGHYPIVKESGANVWPRNVKLHRINGCSKLKYNIVLSMITITMSMTFTLLY